MSGLRPFALARAASVEEASGWLSLHQGEAMLYAGGTELLVLLKAGFARPRVLIDVKRVPGLDAIARRDGDLAFIGKPRKANS